MSELNLLVIEMLLAQTSVQICSDSRERNERDTTFSFSSRELCPQTRLGEWQHINDLEQRKEKLDSVHSDQSHMSLSLQLGKLRKRKRQHPQKKEESFLVLKA